MVWLESHYVLIGVMIAGLLLVLRFHAGFLLRRNGINRGAAGRKLEKLLSKKAQDYVAQLQAWYVLNGIRPPATILWVDDKHPSRNSDHRRILQLIGIQVIAARTNDEAARLVKAGNDVALVISDINRGPDAGAEGLNLPSVLKDRVGDRAPKRFIFFVGKQGDTKRDPVNGRPVVVRTYDLFKEIKKALIDA